MFKVGDRVKCIKTIFAFVNNIISDNVYKIKFISKNGYLNFEGQPPCNWFPDHFVLAEKKENPTYGKCLEILGIK